MKSLGCVLKVEGIFAEATEIYQQVLNIWEKKLSGTRTHVETAMSDPSTVMEAQGKRQEEEELHRNTLKLRRRVWEDQHSSTATRWNNFGIGSAPPV